MKHFQTRPLYLQLHDALAERIANGQWKPGLIPNEGELAREFGVSAGTIRKALDLLETEHIVTRRQGRGTFVNDQTADDLASRFSNIHTLDGRRILGDFRGSTVLEARANEAERERLGLGEDDHVYRNHRIRLDGEQPFMVEDVSLPAARFPTVNEPIPDIVALAQQHGVVLGKAEEGVTIEVATPAVSKLLAIPNNTAVLVLDRMVCCLDGRPPEWRVGFCHLGTEYVYTAQMS